MTIEDIIKNDLPRMKEYLNDSHIDMIRSALEKQVAKKVVDEQYCPNCGQYLEFLGYCPICGQKLEW